MTDISEKPPMLVAECPLVLFYPRWGEKEDGEESTHAWIFLFQYLW
jgi:hypothetical protein